MDSNQYGKSVTARSGLGRNVPFRLNKKKADGKSTIKKAKKLKPLSKPKKSSTLSAADLRSNRDQPRESTSSPAILQFADKKMKSNKSHQSSGLQKKPKPKNAWATPSKEPLQSININVMSDSIPMHDDNDFIPEDLDYGLDRKYDDDFEDIEDESPSSMASPDPLKSSQENVATPQQDDIPEDEEEETSNSEGVFNLTSVNIEEKNPELAEQKEALSKLKKDVDERQKIQITVREELKTYLDLLRGPSTDGTTVVSFPDHFDDVVDMMSKGRTQLSDDLIHEYISAANISDQELMDIETMDEDDDTMSTMTTDSSSSETKPKKKATLLHIRKLELMLSRQEREHDDISKEVDEIMKHDSLLSEILENRKIPLRELLLNEQQYIDEYLAEKEDEKNRLAEELGDQVDSKSLNKSRLDKLSTSTRQKGLENAKEPSSPSSKSPSSPLSKRPSDTPEEPASPPPVFITQSQRARIEEILKSDVDLENNPFTDYEAKVSELDKKISQIKPSSLQKMETPNFPNTDNDDPFTAETEELLKVEEAIADVYSKAMENRNKKIDEEILKKLVREARIDNAKN